MEAARLELEALRAWENPYLDPAPPEEIAQARARLRQAELSVAQLELQLQGAELRAPFDGVISAVYMRPSEWGTPGVPVVEILDTTYWYVETRDVSELAIGQVRVGQEAQVQVLAFRDETLRGRVDTISPVAVVQQGNTTYTLMIEGFYLVAREFVAVSTVLYALLSCTGPGLATLVRESAIAETAVAPDILSRVMLMAEELFPTVNPSLPESRVIRTCPTQVTVVAAIAYEKQKGGDVASAFYHDDHSQGYHHRGELGRMGGVGEMANPVPDWMFS